MLKQLAPRWPIALLSTAGLALALLMMTLSSDGSRSGLASATTPVCSAPLDVSLVLDRSGTMSEAAGGGENKIVAAHEAAKALVDAIAGGPGNASIAPSSMAITTFRNGTAGVDQTLTSSATNLRSVLDSFLTGAGFTNIGEGIRLGEGQLAASSGSIPDYMVLLSDGAANRPATVPPDQIYLDVNDDGLVNAADDLAVDYQHNGTNDFVVQDGRLILSGPNAECNVLDVSSPVDTWCFTGIEDDYDFSADLAAAFDPDPAPNFKVQDANLLVDINGSWQALIQPIFSGGPGWTNTNANIYAQYHAAQAKSRGTTLYVIGYTVGSSDESLLRSLATSPAHYFSTDQVDELDEAFQDLAWTLCPVTPVPPTATPVPPTNTPVPPTNTPVPPTATPVPPTNTPVPPTATPVPPTNTPVPPTNTPVPPTATPVPPTNTPVPPTATPVPPTATPVPPTATPVPPTNTPVPPTNTPVPPTATPVPPTNTPIPPTATPVPPTNTPVPPTNTPVPPTNTPVPPTNTPVPPTNTPVPPTATPVPPTNTPTRTSTPEDDDHTATPTRTRTPTPVSQVSPAAATPTRVTQVIPAAVTPTRSARALPGAGSGGPGGVDGSTLAGFAALLFAGASVLGGLRLLHGRRE